jgi:hypothetical protein
MPEDMGGLLPGVMWIPMAEIKKHMRFYFLCPKTPNYQINAISRGKACAN